jgi:hypothetical protein
VADQLRGADIPLDSINAIMLSHYHVDHIGDPSLFPSTTSLVVGPGFKTNKSSFPGYPKNPDALTVDDAFHGRDIVELEFSNSLEIGGFPAIDYFGDGSFYILQSEGHSELHIQLIYLATSLYIFINSHDLFSTAHDHICALARTSDDTFIFLGGDTAHHPGEYRPTQHLPLPDKIEPSPFDTPTSISACPGKLFETIHPAKEEYRDGSDYKTSPFYKLSPTMNASLSDAEVAVEKMQVMDGLPNVFVIIAHDTSLLDILPFLPSSLNNWPAAGYKRIGAWRFLRDFKKTIRLGEST